MISPETGSNTPRAIMVPTDDPDDREGTMALGPAAPSKAAHRERVRMLQQLEAAGLLVFLHSTAAGRDREYVIELKPAAKSGARWKPGATLRLSLAADEVLPFAAGMCVPHWIKTGRWIIDLPDGLGQLTGS